MRVILFLALVLSLVNGESLGSVQKKISKATKQAKELGDDVKDLAKKSKVLKDGIKVVTCVVDEVGELAASMVKKGQDMQLGQSKNFNTMLGKMQIFNDPNVSTCIAVSLGASMKFCVMGDVPFSAIGDAFGDLLAGIVEAVFEVGKSFLSCGGDSCDLSLGGIINELVDPVLNFLSFEGVQNPGVQICFGTDALVAGTEICVDSSPTVKGSLGKTLKNFFKNLHFGDLGKTGGQIMDFQSGFNKKSVPVGTCMAVSGKAVEGEFCLAGSIDLTDFEKAKETIIESFTARRRRGKKKFKKSFKKVSKKAKKSVSKAAKDAAKKVKDAQNKLKNEAKKVENLKDDVEDLAKEVVEFAKQLLKKAKQLVNNIKFEKPDSVPDIPVDAVDQLLSAVNVFNDPTATLCIAGSLYALEAQFCFSLSVNSKTAREAIVAKIEDLNEVFEYTVMEMYDFVDDMLQDVNKGQIDFVVDLPEDTLDLFKGLLEQFFKLINVAKLMKAVTAVRMDVCISGNVLVGAEMCFSGGISGKFDETALIKGAKKIVMDAINNIMKCELTDLADIAKDAFGLIITTVVKMLDEPGISICTTGEMEVLEGEVCASTTIDTDKMEKAGSGFVDMLFGFM